MELSPGKISIQIKGLPSSDEKYQNASPWIGEAVFYELKPKEREQSTLGKVPFFGSPRQARDRLIVVRLSSAEKPWARKKCTNNLVKRKTYFI